MAGKYKITESVGGKWQDIHDYDDMEKHHPTWKESQKRHYGEIDGHREEFVYSPSGERMVSKDFVLSVEGKASIDIPSPVEGYVRRSPKMDRWGTVEIYDGLGQDAKLIARIRHMDPIHVKDGDKIDYGQMIGRQSNQSPPGTKVGLHTHMDISEGHLDQFKKYIRDLDAGAITPNGYIEKSSELIIPHARGDITPKQDGGVLSSPAAQASKQTDAGADGIYRQGEKGDDIRGLQTTLNLLGRDAQGSILNEDGDFGKHTKAAVEAFQKNNGLLVDGILSRDTLESLGKQSPGQWKVTAPSELLQSVAPISKPEQTVLLSNPSHADHALYKQALAGIEKLPSNSFNSDQERQNAAASIAFESKVTGLKQVDHVVLSTNGTGLFAVQGRMDDPAHHRIYLDKAQAVSHQVEQSTQQAEQETQRQQAQYQQQPPSQVQTSKPMFL